MDLSSYCHSVPCVCVCVCAMWAIKWRMHLSATCFPCDVRNQMWLAKLHMLMDRKTVSHFQMIGFAIRTISVVQTYQVKPTKLIPFVSILCTRESQSAAIIFAGVHLENHWKYFVFLKVNIFQISCCFFSYSPIPSDSTLHECATQTHLHFKLHGLAFCRVFAVSCLSMLYSHSVLGFSILSNNSVRVEAFIRTTYNGALTIFIAILICVFFKCSAMHLL